MKFIKSIKNSSVARYTGRLINFINRNGTIIALIIGVILLINILNNSKAQKATLDNTERLVEANEERTIQTKQIVDRAFEEIRQLKISETNNECLIIKHDNNGTLTEADRKDCRIEAEKSNPPPSPNTSLSPDTKTQKEGGADSPSGDGGNGETSLIQDIMDFIRSLFR